MDDANKLCVRLDHLVRVRGSRWNESKVACAEDPALISRPDFQLALEYEPGVDSKLVEVRRNCSIRLSLPGSDRGFSARSSLCCLEEVRALTMPRL